MRPPGGRGRVCKDGAAHAWRVVGRLHGRATRASPPPGADLPPGLQQHAPPGHPGMCIASMHAPPRVGGCTRMARCGDAWARHAHGGRASPLVQVWPWLPPADRPTLSSSTRSDRRRGKGCCATSCMPRRHGIVLSVTVSTMHSLAHAAADRMGASASLGPSRPLTWASTASRRGVQHDRRARMPSGLRDGHRSRSTSSRAGPGCCWGCCMVR
jgi:hypothetical protein